MKVTNFELSKKLAEIGFKAETRTVWNQAVAGDIQTYYLSELSSETFELTNPFNAYDLETILEALPKVRNLMSDYGWYLNIWFFRNNLAIGYVCEDDPHPDYVLNNKENESLADTAARLLIKLVEAGIINFKE